MCVCLQAQRPGALMGKIALHVLPLLAYCFLCCNVLLALLCLHALCASHLSRLSHWAIHTQGGGVPCRRPTNLMPSEVRFCRTTGGLVLLGCLQARGACAAWPGFCFINSPFPWVSARGWAFWSSVTPFLGAP